MKISFKKISKEEQSFSCCSEEIAFNGKVYSKSVDLVLCDGNIMGTIFYTCDRCGVEFVLDVNEDVVFYISNGPCKHDESEEFNIIEFYDGFIDFNEILHSEIEMIKSDYHYCDSCNQK